MTQSKPRYPQAQKSCPYCGNAFAAPPERKRKCRACRGEVLVKRAPGEEVRRLFTVAEADALEVQWQAVYSRNAALRELATFRVDAAAFDLAKSRAPSGTPDAAVSANLLADIAKRAADQASWHTAKMAAYMLALNLERRGLEFVPAAQASQRAALMELRAAGARRVAIFGEEDGACRPCAALGGRILTIEQALREMPLPCLNCETRWNFSDRGFCRCTYLADLESFED
jgi:hypothetical protein